MPSAPGIAIIGSGLMGPGIAASAALAGHDVVLADCDPARAAGGVDLAAAHIRQLVDGGLVAAEDGRWARARIRSETTIKQALAGAFWVIEAITENLAVKQALFRTLEENTGRDVILTSNTSGLRISDIVRDVKWRDRTATTHFWFPSHLVPLVEIVMGEGTDEAVAVRLREILQGWGKAPVIVRKDLPGQLANRVLQAVIREATAIVESGLASAEDVDTAIKMGMGLRFPAWGPLEHVDTVGLELCVSVQNNVLPGLCNEPRAVPLFDRLIAEGNTGAKAGKGFHDWSARSHADLVAQRDRFLMQALHFLGRGHPAAVGSDDGCRGAPVPCKSTSN
ncbi:MAG: 3-hydroxyacyl-CoA dehydrogenase family protein [Rhodospirillales bacterium]|nr:3-hydroxyacyl-CoA dehydrogenase family protein [Rhodospirillales bacterium]